MLRPRLSLLLPLLALLLPAHAQDALDCEDQTLSTYLTSLLDLLYDQGLSTFENLVVSLSSTDSGYALLEQWAYADSITLLVPTDEAFAAANYSSDLSGWSEWALTDLGALHTIQGSWGYSSLPNAPLHGIASSLLNLTSAVNGTGTAATQAVVMSQGDDNAVIVEGIDSNGTSWTSAVDGSNYGLTNVVVLPVSAVIPPSPSLSDALAQLNLTKFAAALASSSIGGAKNLEALTASGFTIFAPLDSAFEGVSPTDADLQTLYATNFSLYSPFWYDSGTFPSLSVASSASLELTYNWTGSYVEFASAPGGGAAPVGGATIVRSDVTLQNGVLHIIDNLLIVPSTPPASSIKASLASATTKPVSTAGSGTSAPSSSTTAGTSEDQSGGAGPSRSQSGLVMTLVAALLLTWGFM